MFARHHAAGGAGSSPPPAESGGGVFRLPLARTLLIVLTLAGLVRLLALGTLPLVLTADSAGYISAAREVASGSFPTLTSYRTPGYPMVAGLALALFGESPVGILIVQHALSLAMMGCVTWAVHRRVGSLPALATGVLLSLDPWLLLGASFALTEGPFAAFLGIASALLLVACAPPRREGERPLSRTRWALLIAGSGLSLGMAVLVRPAAMLFIPPFVLGTFLAPWAIIPTWKGRARRGVLGAGAMLAALALTVGSWRIYNEQRGVHALAYGGELAVWLGAENAGLSDPDYPLSPEVREAYDAFLAGPRDDGRRWEMFFRLDILNNTPARAELGRWAWHSIGQRPRDAAERAGHMLLGLLNSYPKGSTHYSEVAWMAGVLSPPVLWHTDASPPNLRTGGNPQVLMAYSMHARGGPLSRVYLWLSKGGSRPMVSAPLVLGVVSCLAILLLLWKGRLAESLILAAPLAYLLAHAVILQPYNRYGLPIWPLLWLGPALLVLSLRPREAWLGQALSLLRTRPRGHAPRA